MKKNGFIHNPENRPGRVRSRKGFTLIEMILAVSILAMVVTTVFTSLRIGINAWEKGEKNIDFLQAQRSVHTLLFREINSAVPYRLPVGELDQHLKYNSFFGESDTIKFVSYISSTRTEKGLTLLEFWVDEETGLMVGEHKALMSSHAELDDIDLRDEERAVCLCSRISEMTLRYFDRENPDEEGEWLDRWDPKNMEKRLPLFVEIVLTYTDETEDEFEETMIVPVIASS